MILAMVLHYDYLLLYFLDSLVVVVAAAAVVAHDRFERNVDLDNFSANHDKHAWNAISNQLPEDHVTYEAER